MSTHHAHHHHVKKALALGGSNEGFLNSAVGPAQSAEQVTGVPASITIAQAVLESSWGHHHIGDANNYFGIKARPKRGGGHELGLIAIGFVSVPTREVRNGKSTTETAPFRKYRNMVDSFVDHGLFIIQNGRYRSALANYASSGDANAFAVGLQAANYATDPHYAESLISIMQKHNLYRFNRARSGA